MSEAEVYWSREPVALIIESGESYFWATVLKPDETYAHVRIGPATLRDGQLALYGGALDPSQFPLPMDEVIVKWQEWNTALPCWQEERPEIPVAWTQ